MTDHHHHDHSDRNLKAAFFLNLGFTLFEIVGGFYVNSVAILSDAVHDLGDSLSLGLSWYLNKKSRQKASKTFTFGYRRFSLLGALINSLVLIAGSTYVIYEAVKRLIEPEHSNAEGMIVFAVIGVAVNGYAAWKMSSGRTLNERVVSWHLLEDVLGWFAVLVVAIVLLFIDVHFLDPALSLLITAYVLFNVIKRLKETLFIFLQGQPSAIDRAEIEQQMINIKFVDSLHHTHVWSLDGERHVFSTHVKLQTLPDFNALQHVKSELKKTLRPYRFEHYTIETELADEQCDLDPE